MTIEFRPSKLTTIVYTLSRKAQLVVLEENELLFPMGIQVEVSTYMEEKIKNGMHKHSTNLNIMKHVKVGKP